MSIREQQLNKISTLATATFDPATNTYYIPKFVKPNFELQKCYLVKIPGEMVNNTSTDISVNWNHSTAPQTRCLKIYISKQLGKMIYVDTLGYDLEKNVDLANVWSGWLNVDQLILVAYL